MAKTVDCGLRQQSCWSAGVRITPCLKSLTTREIHARMTSLHPNMKLNVSWINECSSLNPPLSSRRVGLACSGPYSEVLKQIHAFVLREASETQSCYVPDAYVQEFRDRSTDIYTVLRRLPYKMDI